MSTRVCPLKVAVMIELATRRLSHSSSAEKKEATERYSCGHQHGETMHRFRGTSAVLALSVVVGGELIAQPGQPKVPTTPTLAIITLQSVRLEGTPISSLRYQRAGTSPAEYRAGTNATFSGASWVAFTESGTTSTTNGSTTVITGRIPAANPYYVGVGCPPNSVKHRVFLQMRRFTQGRMVNSNVVSDSTCVPFG